METQTATQTATKTWVHPFEAAGLGKAPYRFVRFEKAMYQACQGAPIQPGTSCDYCGTGIMNVFWVRSIDGRDFKTGCDCIYKIYKGAPKADALLIEVRKADRAMRAQRRAELSVEKRAAYQASRRLVAQQRAVGFLAANPGLDQALTIDHPIIADIAAKLQQYGDLSPRQVEFVWKLYGEAYGPAKPEETHVPAPEGKVEVLGTIVSVKSHDSMYGTVSKMTVKVTDGRNVWLCWGTVPNNLFTDSYVGKPGAYHHRSYEELRGCTVRFTATLNRGRDAHFALFKRPTKATIISNPNA